MGDDNVLSDGGGGGQSWEVDTGLQKRENVCSTVLVWNNAQVKSYNQF